MQSVLIDASSQERTDPGRIHPEHPAWSQRFQNRAACQSRCEQGPQSQVYVLDTGPGPWLQDTARWPSPWLTDSVTSSGTFLLASPQLIAWEPEQEEEVTMVTARPNFQDSIHVGFVSGLKKFTEYFTSVLCFTTPGDGPRSSPQLVRTHEDGRWPGCSLVLPSCPGYLRSPWGCLAFWL